MRSIDFLSPSPKVFIFQDKANHTMWGGLFFMFYIFIMFFISLVYIYDFCSNDKYEVEYTLTDTYLTSGYGKISSFFSSPKQIPVLDFSFDFFDANLTYANNNGFLLYNLYTKQFIDRNTTPLIKMNISHLCLGVVYKCDGDNCSNNFDENKNYYISLNYRGYTLDHQNKNKPLYIDENNWYRMFFRINFGATLIRELSWHTIKYKKDEGIKLLIEKLKGEKDEYIGGHFEYYDSYNITDQINMTEIDGKYRFLTIIRLTELEDRITYYKRKKIGWLDVLAKIGALFTTFNAFFTKFFEFYSNSFDNYKIVDKILTS